MLQANNAAIDQSKGFLQANAAVLAAQGGAPPQTLAAPFQTALNSAMEDWRADTQKILAEQQAQTQSHLDGTVHHLFGKLDQSIQNQFAQQQAELNTHSEQIAELFRLIKALQDDNNALRTSRTSALPASSLSSNQHSSDPNWLATPNGTIIRGHSADLVELSAFAQAIGPWLKKHGFSPGVHYRVEGDSEMPSQNFVVQFLGEDEVATKKCSLALRRQKQSSGTWEQFFAQCPGGAWAQVFLGGDKNGFQVAKEIGTRRLGNIISAFPAVPKEQLLVARREGALLINWEPLCILEPQESGSFMLKWSEPILAKWSIDKAVATAEFTRSSEEALSGRRAIAARLAQTQWSP